MRRLILEIARSNPLWGTHRICHEVRLKLAANVSHETVRKYLRLLPQRPASGQRWATFVRNHAKAIVAGDLFTVVTAGFRTLYVLVVMEIGSRRIIHLGVTAHPTAGWVQQRLREAIPCDHAYRFFIHDRDAAFSRDVDRTLSAMGLRVLKTPIRAPQTNAFCERLIGTTRRECLDHLIPIGENHLRLVLQEWAEHYNRGRPHSSLGPGIPEPAADLPESAPPATHRLPEGYRVVATPVLGGLHHEYRLEKVAA